MSDTIQVYVITIPHIDGGKPNLWLLVGLPTTEDGKILPPLCDPETEFLGYSLVTTWGYAQPKPPLEVEIPQDACCRWYWERYHLDNWGEIPEVVEEELATLRKVLENYRKLTVTQPAREMRIITL
jgi:hypothetical protein